MDRVVRVRRRPRAPAVRPTLRFERLARGAGYASIAGVDEVGRGALCGPVVAAAVILRSEAPIQGLADSKLLDAARREVLAARIRDRAVAWAVAAVDAAWIDRLNIYQASRRAMEEAVRRLNPPPDYVLTDAMKLDVPFGQRALIDGDARCRSIAAASIVAKVERDRWMRLWHQVFPDYGWESNKGYSTPDHLEALNLWGPSPIHRYTFAPVAAVAPYPVSTPCEPPSEQIELFSPEETAQ